MIRVCVGSSGGAEDVAYAVSAEDALSAARVLYLEQGTRAGYRTVCFYDADDVLLAALDGAELQVACRRAGV